MSVTERDPCEGALTQLWEEYKYRHEHIWRIILQVTVASVLLGILPYVEMRLAKLIPWPIVAVAVLAIAVAGYGLWVLLNEIDELDLVKTKYREKRLECLGVEMSGQSHFRGLVIAYFVVLLVVGVINLLALLCVWVPLMKVP
jgi:hypothetical protein